MMDAEEERASPDILWLPMALVCLTAGLVVPGWAAAVPDSLRPWAFLSIAVVAVAVIVVSGRGRGPTWMKVATSIAAGLAAMGALTFAALNFMM